MLVWRVRRVCAGWQPSPIFRVRRVLRRRRKPPESLVKAFFVPDKPRGHDWRRLPFAVVYSVVLQSIPTFWAPSRSYTSPDTSCGLSVLRRVRLPSCLPCLPQLLPSFALPRRGVAPIVLRRR